MASDPLDNAVDYQDAMNNQSLADQLARHRFDKPSREDCLDCGIEIPKKRQELGGVDRCTECEGYHQRERQQKGYR